MNRDSKRISNSLRPSIENIKGHIRSNTGRGFDGDGYPFKQAVREMKVELGKQGKTIKYCNHKCSYFVVPVNPVLERVW
ncbi:MAG: hypothetical protein EOO52_13290 [Gammaproteobacteria bacterium]|nr:MAG: hypothetical protein EOO52_13290 [Gammaproteobacteria bacterium]